MSLFSSDKISEKEYNKAIKIIEAYEKQKKECCCHHSCHCCHSHCCSCKPIKVGCLVKYTSEAHKNIGSAVDTKIHRVKEIEERAGGSPLVRMCDGKFSDISWLEHA